jgi:hypothetical protein
MLIRITKAPRVAPRVEQEPEQGEMIRPITTDVETGSGTDEAGSGTADRTPGTRRRGWTPMIVAIVAIVGVATIVIVADGGSGQATTTAAAVAGPEVGSQAFLQRLAEQGYIPQQAVDRELLLLEQAIARGDIPAATLDAPGGTAYHPAELLLLEAVASGQVPPQALSNELRERERAAPTAHDSGIGVALRGRERAAPTAHDSGIGVALRGRLLDEARSNAASTARLEGLADRELGR